MRPNNVLFYGLFITGVAPIALACTGMYPALLFAGMDAGMALFLLFFIGIPALLLVLAAWAIFAARLWHTGRTKWAWCLAAILVSIPAAVGVTRIAPTNPVPPLLRAADSGMVDADALNTRLHNLFPAGSSVESVTHELSGQHFGILLLRGQARMADFSLPSGTNGCRTYWHVTWTADHDEKLIAIKGQFSTQC